MSSNFKRILYGGDYNPNQWSKEVWKEDMRIFKDAHINTATINVFSWAKIQPSEHEYYFDELDEIVDMLSKENYDIVFATSTAALPGWMVRKYPEVMFADYEGRRHKFGMRHNACPNSLVFKHYARELAHKLAERYADNPHVTCWHISNEYGGECFCENCQKAFRVWLKDKYKTIDALNEAWNMEFWGHTVYDWDDVVAPNALGDGIGTEKTAFAGISIDYRRFYSDSQLECFKMERDAIRSVKPDAFITTNLMGTFNGLDYFKWAKEMDVVSWDNYPAYDTPWSSIAMTHDLMRGLKDEPFMLMEQTPRCVRRATRHWHTERIQSSFSSCEEAWVDARNSTALSLRMWAMRTLAFSVRWHSLVQNWKASVTAHLDPEMNQKSALSSIGIIIGRLSTRADLPRI